MPRENRDLFQRNVEITNFCKAEGRVCDHADNPYAFCHNPINTERAKGPLKMYNLLLEQARKTGDDKIVTRLERTIKVLSDKTSTAQDLAIDTGRCGFASVAGKKGLMAKDEFKQGWWRRFTNT